MFILLLEEKRNIKKGRKGRYQKKVCRDIFLYKSNSTVLVIGNLAIFYFYHKRPMAFCPYLTIGLALSY